MHRVLLAALLLQVPQVSCADPLANAYFVCDLFAKTGVSTECRASEVTSTIDVTIDTSAAEAGNVCSVIANNMAQKGRAFGGQWKLRVFAPDRADQPLAMCALR